MENYKFTTNALAVYLAHNFVGKEDFGERKFTISYPWQKVEQDLTLKIVWHCVNRVTAL